MSVRTLATHFALACAVAAAPVFAQPADGKPQTLPITRIKVGGHPVDAEVAATPPERQLGLMYRFNLPSDRGMLFVFPRPEPLSFWMRNTFVPLSIAFIDADGRILNIEDMAPRDETGVPSRGAALYALEMRKGWFADRGVVAGARVTGLPPASRQ
jgi:uncharacterized membrane protein (UPF0127 family)